MHSKAHKLSLLLAILGWFAVITQLVLMILNRTASLAETLTRFFSYFTILTNLLVSIAFTSLVQKDRSNWNSFFSKPSTQTALTLYILVVGLVYNCILRALWSPVGFQKLTDELLHTIIPLLCLIYWIAFVPKNSLHWKNSFVWLVYPAIYSLGIAIRGAFSGFYPYPFINVSELGYPATLRNGLWLLVFFWGLSLLLIGAAQLFRLNKNSTQY
jgi:hypothetical protein